MNTRYWETRAKDCTLWSESSLASSSAQPNGQQPDCVSDAPRPSPTRHRSRWKLIKRNRERRPPQGPWLILWPTIDLPAPNCSTTLNTRKPPVAGHPLTIMVNLRRHRGEVKPSTELETNNQYPTRCATWIAWLLSTPYGCR